MSIGDDLENLIFPFDWQAPRYHAECLIFIDEVIQSIATFLNTDQELAENLFLEFACGAEIDIFSLEPGNSTELCLPATREGAVAIFNHCKDFGLHCLYDEQLIILFSIEQVETMINESIKGLAEPFSVRQLIEQDKKPEKLSYVTTSSSDATIYTDLHASFEKDSSFYPPELDAALQAWRAVSTSKVDSKRTAKDRIESWLDKNTKMSKEAKKRIKIVANWNKIGGAPRTDEK